MNGGQQDDCSGTAVCPRLTSACSKPTPPQENSPPPKWCYTYTGALVGVIHRCSWTARMVTATLLLTLWASPQLAYGQPMESDYNGQFSEVPIVFEEEVQPSPEPAQESSTLYEPTTGSEPSLTENGSPLPQTGQQSNDGFTEPPPSLIEISTLQEVSEGATATPFPGRARGLDAIVPFMLPLRPYAPVFSGSEGSMNFAPGSNDSGVFPVPEDAAEASAPPRFAFYGPQSDELRVDDCQHFDAFLVSPLPSSVGSKFSEFVQKEASQADGMPYLHHIHGRPVGDPADGEENPRLIVEGGKVTPLWSEFTEENPIFRMDEGTVTLIRLVAPVKSAFDAMASMMLMPIVDVSLAYGDGLRLSYKVSGEEGRQADHQHQDETHRPVAELHVVYKSCFSVEGESSDPISVRAELRFGGCEPVVLMWKVVCSAGALLQGKLHVDLAQACVPSGFHIAIGPLTPAASKDKSASLMRSSADLPWDPSLAPSPTVADLRAVTSKEGDLVSNGVVADHVASVQPGTLVFDPSKRSPQKLGGRLQARDVSSADLPWDPSLAPSPTVADLRAVTSKEGDLVSNGVVADHVASVQPDTLVFDPSSIAPNLPSRIEGVRRAAALPLEDSSVRYFLSCLQQDFVEMYAWCRGSADLQVMYPLLYNYVGSSQKEETETEQSVSLVASKPSSHVVLREVLPGLEENVRRFILQFQCKSEGESIVGIDFSFHGYRDIQIFLKKKCVAPASASLRDPSCSSGVLSEGGEACCVASCGTCGGDGCEDREGGLPGCCAKHILSSALPCAVATAPCVMGGGLPGCCAKHILSSALPCAVATAPCVMGGEN
ncbi:hypothetical protein, conserved [Eimeria praecox]|uniref:Uncharacterized protein n=1 Tax=Eimeria praecox TaxID=51316 RepID=U6H1T0_9EIME|nr:hypothetical protein, conserved [Eimeria praecox]